MSKENTKQSPINQLFLNYLKEPAFTGTAVAKTIASGFADPTDVTEKGLEIMKEKKNRKTPKCRDEVALPTVPKNIVLRLLRDGLKAGAISRVDVEKIITETAGPDLRVDRSLRDKAKDLTLSMGINKDGLKFSVKSPAPGKLKLYLLGTNNRVAMEKISEYFTDLNDMERAAGAVVERYLESLCKNG